MGADVSPPEQCAGHARQKLDLHVMAREPSCLVASVHVL